MKRVFLMFTLLLVSWMYVSANGFGVKIGYISSKLSVYDYGDEYYWDKDSKSNVGSVSFGFFYDYSINKNIDLRAELYYGVYGNSWQGFYQSYYYDKKETVKTKFTCFTLPLLVKVNTGIGKTGNFYVLGGPYLSYISKANTVLKVYYDNEFDHGYDWDLKDMPVNSAKDFDFGLIAGLGVEFQTNEKYVMSFEFRYKMGLAKVVGDAKIRGLEVSAGFGF